MSQIPNIPINPDAGSVTMTLIKRVLNLLLEGSSNACGVVTLSNAATATTLIDNHITPTCKIFFWAQTANAAAVSASLWYDLTSIPVSGQTFKKQLTLNHSSAAHADLTFGYLIIQ